MPAGGPFPSSLVRALTGTAPLPLDRTSSPADLAAPVFLYTTFYRDEDPARAAELDAALRLNASLPWIGRIVVVTEEEHPSAQLPQHVELVRTMRRWTFREMFDLAARTLQNALKEKPAEAGAWVGDAPPPGGDFLMGRFFCDGVLARQMWNAGWLLKNPCKEARIYHLHRSNGRRAPPGAWIGGSRIGVSHSDLDTPFTNGDLYDDGWNP